MTIGEKIKELRTKRNLSLDDVSIKTNIKRSLLKKIEDDVTIPSRDNLYALCDYFEIEEKEIINDETLQGTKKIEASKSINNFIYWIMNVIVYLFFIIVAFIPSLASTDANGVVTVYSFYTLLLASGNQLTIVSFVFSIIGFILSLGLVILRYYPKIKLNGNIIMVLNIIILAILILVIVNIFIVISTYYANFVNLII